MWFPASWSAKVPRTHIRSMWLNKRHPRYRDEGDRPDRQRARLPRRHRRTGPTALRLAGGELVDVLFHCPRLAAQDGAQHERISARQAVLVVVRQHADK